MAGRLQGVEAPLHLGTIGWIDLEGCRALAHGLRINPDNGRQVGNGGGPYDARAHARSIDKSQKQSAPAGPGRSVCVTPGFA